MLWNLKKKKNVRCDEVAIPSGYPEGASGSECFVGVCSWTHVMWDLTHKIGVPHRHEWFLSITAGSAFFLFLSALTTTSSIGCLQSAHGITSRSMEAAMGAHQSDSLTNRQACHDFSYASGSTLNIPNVKTPVTFPNDPLGSIIRSWRASLDVRTLDCSRRAVYDLGFSFFSFHRADRPTPETLTTLKRTPGISPLALPLRPKPARRTSSFSSTKFKQPSLGTVVR